MTVLAIDPGPERSSYVLWDGRQILDHYDFGNVAMLCEVIARAELHKDAVLVIEQIASYGMAVGASVFETCFWSGRFAQAWGREFHRLPRKDVKMHLCGSMKAKDGNIRQALIDRLGPPGTKKAPGPTYGIKADEWAALAVAVTWFDQQQMRRAA